MHAYDGKYAKFNARQSYPLYGIYSILDCQMSIVCVELVTALSKYADLVTLSKKI